MGYTVFILALALGYGLYGKIPYYSKNDVQSHHTKISQIRQKSSESLDSKFFVYTHIFYQFVKLLLNLWP